MMLRFDGIFWGNYFRIRNTIHIKNMLTRYVMFILASLGQTPLELNSGVQDKATVNE